MEPGGDREQGEVPVKWRERYRSGVGTTMWRLFGASIQLPFGALLLVGTVGGLLGGVSEAFTRTHGWALAKSLGAMALIGAFGGGLGSVLVWYAFAMLADGLGARRTLKGAIEQRTIHAGKGSRYSIVVQGVLVWVPREVYQGLHEGHRVRLECGRFERALNMLWSED